jgi:hypothetical protein
MEIEFGEWSLSTFTRMVFEAPECFDEVNGREARIPIVELFIAAVSWVM